jgi:hypothetical protein
MLLSDGKYSIVEGFARHLGKIVNLLPQLPFRIIHGLLGARRSRPVGSRPLFILGDRFFGG